MIKTTKRNGLTLMHATEAPNLHKLSTDEWFPANRILLPSESLDDFEEGTEPPYSKSDYDAKVAELVRQRYSESEEAGIQRKMINTITAPQVCSADEAARYVQEYEIYNAYVEECKVRARGELEANPPANIDSTAEE